jgi:hypothetical protein
VSDVERGTDWSSQKREFVKLDVMCCWVTLYALGNSKVASYRTEVWLGELWKYQVVSDVNMLG